jgi:endonuclease/exonuclease/phosphatase family metal-dependent hydrolase
LVLFKGNDPRGINIALMSKLEVQLAETHRSDKFKKNGDPHGQAYRYARDCLEVHMMVGQRPVVLLGVHYKAKENDNPDKRLAEAQHTRAIADRLTEEDPDRAVLILGDFNDTPGSSAYDWTLGSDPTRYRNAADHVQAQQRWTFNYKGKLELVDQQMANDVLYSMLDQAEVEIPHSAEVEAASDHSPVIATYEIK